MALVDNITTTMTELSFAAQAVWDAAWANFSVQCGNIEGTRRAQVAAALRAAADQVVPKRSMPLYVGEATHADWSARDDVRDDLLRIATELEGAQ